MLLIFSARGPYACECAGGHARDDNLCLALSLHALAGDLNARALLVKYYNNEPRARCRERALHKTGFCAHTAMDGERDFLLLPLREIALSCNNTGELKQLCQ
jgi:hypothetical protein